MEKETRETKVGVLVYKSFGLTEEQHNAAVELLTKNKREVGTYTIEENDDEVVNIWILDAFAESDKQYATTKEEIEECERSERYARFLQSSLGEGATIYTLHDNLGGFSQPIGEIAVK